MDHKIFWDIFVRFGEVFKPTLVISVASGLLVVHITNIITHDQATDFVLLATLTGKTITRITTADFTSNHDGRPNSDLANAVYAQLLRRCRFPAV